LSVQWDPQGFWLAAVNHRGSLCLWEVSKGRQLLRWKLEKPSSDAQLAIDPTGRHLTVFGLDGAVRLYDLLPVR